MGDASYGNDGTWRSPSPPAVAAPAPGGRRAGGCRDHRVGCGRRALGLAHCMGARRGELARRRPLGAGRRQPVPVVGLRRARGRPARAPRRARRAPVGRPVRTDAVHRRDGRPGRARVRARDRPPAYRCGRERCADPGLDAAEAARLRDRLAKLGEAAPPGCERPPGRDWHRLHPLSPSCAQGAGRSRSPSCSSRRSERPRHCGTLVSSAISALLVVPGSSRWLVTRWRVDETSCSSRRARPTQSLRFPLAQVQAIDVIGLARPAVRRGRAAAADGGSTARRRGSRTCRPRRGARAARSIARARPARRPTRAPALVEREERVLTPFRPGGSSRAILIGGVGLLAEACSSRCRDGGRLARSGARARGAGAAAARDASPWSGGGSTTATG